MEKRLTGILGEKLVCKWYTDHKYKLLAVNYHTHFGEIDVVAQYKNIVVFCEVKTRKNNKYYNASEAVTYSKQQRIKKSAQVYVQQNNLEGYYFRFDIAEVYHPDDNPEINIIEDAFQ